MSLPSIRSLSFAAVNLIVATAIPFVSPARAAQYDLVIDRTVVNATGKPIEKLTVNGRLPAPTLRFKEGEEVTVRVTNRLNEDTSVHWHGFLIPGDQDGVPGFNGFPGIKPGETFTYRFPIRQSGTYWYHSHSAGQEQDGLYGAVIIEPAAGDIVKPERDYVIVLSDFHEQSAADIHRTLKVAEGSYNYGKRTLGDFFDDASRMGFGAALRDRLDWGEMRMDPTDLVDVAGYTFLVNGNSPALNWTGLFKPGEKVRLRFVNASAMSYYDVRIPGLRMIVIQADGQNVQPVPVDEFRIAVAETYDVIVVPREDKAYTIFAEPIDRSGYARATLAPRAGMQGAIPERKPRAILTMADMGMAHEGMDHGAMPEMSGMDHTAMGHGAMAEPTKDRTRPQGWADAATPPDKKALAYADLKSLAPQKDTRPPQREIVVRLGGQMNRFIWTINGQKFEDSEPIALAFGERVKLTFVNETMMAHPMHLHGMFVQLVNGQAAERLPNKHVVNVAPGATYSALLTADEPGEWAFHCHLLFHMASGMMAKVVVARLQTAEAAR